ncbi:MULTISPECIES: hypothetical protein [Peribacillus]|uniref:Uncharacterized protein n=1 Tax=Peribacillus simplex TaxID=1478 RepID=A0A109MSX9_9BACI|nr:hypothetical protein [Peribacillus simplex]KWW11574.1 hypothetical protein AS888_00930 [Peribacillus simplex]
MDLDQIWHQFIVHLLANDEITEASVKKFTGIPFIYIHYQSPEKDEGLLFFLIKKAASHSMRGKQLHCETIFVRQEEQVYVFRHRFFVPQKKMFCCGNLCPDCILFRS